MSRSFAPLLLYIATVPIMTVAPFRLGGQLVLLCDIVFVLVVLFWLPTAFRENLRPSSFEVLLHFTWWPPWFRPWFPGPATGAL